MTKQEKDAVLAELHKERERLNQWENVLNSDNGKNAKFLKSELNKIANDTRNLYKNINPFAQDVATQLAMLIGREVTTEKFLKNFADLQIRKNKLDKQIQSVIESPLSEEVSEPLTRQAE